MVTVSVHCPRCHSNEIYRHGLSPTERERFRCQCCHPVFQLTYRYEARKPRIKEQIVDMAFKRCRCSRYHQNLENRHQHAHPGFKKLSPRRITSSPVAHADLALICELDEQWSFVGSKALQHWLWYAYNTGGVLAYTFGLRTDETCRELLALLTPFKGFYLSIPLYVLTVTPNRTRAQFNWTPLTRDGGQMVGRKYYLYGLTDERSPAVE